MNHRADQKENAFHVKKKCSAYSINMDRLKSKVASQVFVKDMMPDRPRRPQYGASVALTWTKDDVTNWALNQGLCQTACALRRFQTDGRRLLNIDALTLQKYGVSNGHEAVLAEQEIQRLTCRIDPTIADTRRFPIDMHRALHQGKLPCPCYPVLAMLSTDPWQDNATKLIDVRERAARDRRTRFGC